ncbi:hypothetical protein Tco_0963908, partial [Tanacetum coccineum]
MITGKKEGSSKNAYSRLSGRGLSSRSGEEQGGGNQAAGEYPDAFVKWVMNGGMMRIGYAAKEEQLAIENISAILRNLTSKQTLRVSEVSRKIDEVSSQDNKMMLQDVSNMMQVSDDGKTEVNKYIEKAADKVGNSLQHWDNTKLAINRFNERNMVEIESFIRETIQVNNLRSEEIAAAYVSMDTKFQSDASDLKSCVN